MIVSASALMIVSASALTPLYVKSVTSGYWPCCRSSSEIDHDTAVDFAGEKAFQAANDLALRTTITVRRLTYAMVGW